MGSNYDWLLETSMAFLFEREMKRNEESIRSWRNIMKNSNEAEFDAEGKMVPKSPKDLPEFEDSSTHVFVGDSGAKRSCKKLPYWMIPLEPLILISERYLLGAEKYSINNWVKGAKDPAYVRDVYSHLFEHLLKIRTHGDEEDDMRGTLAAVCWNAFALAYFYIKEPKVFEKAFYSDSRGEF